jgi:hypothetical protein
MARPTLGEEGIMAIQPRSSRAAALGLMSGLLLVLAMVAPAAAKPQRIVIPFGTPEDNIATGEWASAVCGYPIDATTRSGHLIIHLFEKSTGVVEIDNYNTVRMVFTNPENKKRYVVQIDAGPDIVRVGRDGRVTVAITGHSTTGSGLSAGRSSTPTRARCSP